MRGLRRVRVELDRLRAQRSAAVVLVLAAGLMAVLVTAAAYATRPVDETERAAAQQQLTQQLEAGQREVRQCRAEPSEYFGQDATPADCRELRPQLDWFLNRPELDLARELDGRGTTLLVLLAAAAMIVGATFSGSDWATGSMGHQLLFTPHRGRLWAAKAIAVVVSSVAVSLVLWMLFWGALWAFTLARGLDTSAATLDDLLLTSVRGMTLVAALALGSFALTMLVRHTVATVSLLFAYAVVGEALAASLPVSRMSRWSVSDNVVAWLDGSNLLTDPRLCPTGAGPCDPTYTLGAGHAAAYLGALLALAVAVSLWSFLRRDVP